MHQVAGYNPLLQLLSTHLVSLSSCRLSFLANCMLLGSLQANYKILGFPHSQQNSSLLLIDDTTQCNMLQQWHTLTDSTLPTTFTLVASYFQGLTLLGIHHMVICFWNLTDFCSYQSSMMNEMDHSNNNNSSSDLLQFANAVPKHLLSNSKQSIPLKICVFLLANSSEVSPKITVQWALLNPRRGYYSTHLMKWQPCLWWDT